MPLFDFFARHVCIVIVQAAIDILKTCMRHLDIFDSWALSINRGEPGTQLPNCRFVPSSEDDACLLQVWLFVSVSSSPCRDTDSQ